MPDYREELLNRILTCLCKQGIDDLGPVKYSLIRVIEDYDITKRATELMVSDAGDLNLVKAFLASKRVEGGSPNTATTRWYVLKRFLEDLNKPLREIKTFDILGWLAKEQTRVKLSTAESYRTMISSLFSWLCLNKVISENPTLAIGSIRHPDTIKTSFNPVEIDSLRGACTSLLERSILEVLLSSGIRCEELCKLKWRDINFETKDVMIIEGKGRKNRVTMIDDVTKKYLLAYKGITGNQNSYIFTVKYRGVPKRRTTDSVWRMLKNLGKRAGVDAVNPHKFRHTFATTLYKRGLDVRMIQQLLGHSNINVTMVYIDSDIDMLRDEYRKHI